MSQIFAYTPGNEFLQESKYSRSPKILGKSVEEDTSYRLKLLDPHKLPAGVTAPEKGRSRSSDYAGKTKFETVLGGIMRYDKLNGDIQRRTFIPFTENWVKAQNEASNPLVGDVYTRQNSAYSFGVQHFRGEGRGAPADYEAGAYDSWVKKSLPSSESVEVKQPAPLLAGKDNTTLNPDERKDSPEETGDTFSDETLTKTLALIDKLKESLVQSYKDGSAKTPFFLVEELQEHLNRQA